MIIISLFKRAADYIEYRLQLRSLRLQERRYWEILEFHQYQLALAASSQIAGVGPHGVASIFARAHALQAQHAQKSLESGKSFWEANNIDTWAKQIMRLQKVGRGDDMYMWAELPDSAIAPLHNRIIQLRRQRALDSRL